MSESLLRNPMPERTARVWQSADFQSGGAAAPAFEPSAWAMAPAPAFGLQSYTPPDPPAGQPEFGDDGFAFSDGSEPAPALAPAEPSPPMLAAPVPPAGMFSQDDLNLVSAQSYEQGRVHGMQQALEQGRAEAEHSRGQVHQRLTALEATVQELAQSPEQMHEPLKRLALHLAEQLVLAELSISPQAIERLVQRCVDELAAQRGESVLIELHPDDLAPMQELRAMSAEGAQPDEPKKMPAWVLQANASLLPGSVRASANDAVVSDLIEHRLDDLARQLLAVPAPARRQSAFQSERLAARRAEVSQVLDAQPRMAEPPRNPRFGAVIEADASPVSPPDEPIHD